MKAVPVSANSSLAQINSLLLACPLNQITTLHQVVILVVLLIVILIINIISITILIIIICWVTYITYPLSSMTCHHGGICSENKTKNHLLREELKS